MVQEQFAQFVGVGEKPVDRAFREFRESFVGGREDGERTGGLEGLDETSGLCCGEQRLEAPAD